MISKVTKIPVPGNLIGMGLLFLALTLRLIRVETMELSSGILLKYLALFLIPAGVGLVEHVDLISANFIPILVAMTASTFLVISVSGLLVRYLK